MEKIVLFIQGVGEGAYDADQKLVDSLQKALGVDYRVIYPRMPDEDNPASKAWKSAIAEALARLDGAVIVVGHSVGAFIVLKYLSEEPVHQSISGIFLLAAPYVGAGGWEVGESPLRDDFAAWLPKAPLFFYHSRDDETVPFDHLALYTAKLPYTTVRELDTGGHQFNNDLSEVASDILRL